MAEETVHFWIEEAGDAIVLHGRTVLESGATVESGILAITKDGVSLLPDVRHELGMPRELGGFVVTRKSWP